jgi:hypothetical protein
MDDHEANSYTPPSVAETNQPTRVFVPTRGDYDVNQSKQKTVAERDAQADANEDALAEMENTTNSGSTNPQGDIETQDAGKNSDAEYE